MSFYTLIIACQGHISVVTVIFEFSNGCLKFCLKLLFYKFDDSEKNGDYCEYDDLREFGDAGESCDSIESCFFLVMLVIFN